MAGTEQSGMGGRRVARVKTGFTLAFIVGGIAFVARNAAEFSNLAWPSPHAVAAVAAGFAVSVFCRALYNYIASRGLGANLLLGESFMLSAVVTASNLLLPANPGAAFRAMYMKRVHGFPYGFFASSTLLYAIVTVLMTSLVGIFLLVLIQTRLGYARPDLYVALPAIAAASGVALLLRGRRSAVSEESVWTSFASSYLRLVRDYRLVIASISIVALNFSVGACVWVVALQDYAPEIDVLEASLFAASQIVSGLINLTPGAAGFQELVGVYVGRSFSLSVVELFAILVWVRVVRSVAAISLGIPCAIALRRKTR